MRCKIRDIKQQKIGKKRTSKKATKKQIKKHR